MLRRAAGRADSRSVCADSHRLPFADASVDIIVSNLMVPGCADPVAVFREARRVLRTPGLLLFSTLGPDTLKEVRRAWPADDPHPHVHAFADMHNIGDALVGAGFREPVMDVEMLTVNYREVRRLVTDLRAVAATNQLAARRRSLTGTGRWRELCGKSRGRPGCRRTLRGEYRSRHRAGLDRRTGSRGAAARRRGSFPAVQIEVLVAGRFGDNARPGTWYPDAAARPARYWHRRLLRHHRVRLNQTKKPGHEQQHEQGNRQRDAHGKRIDHALGIALVLEHEK